MIVVNGIVGMVTDLLLVCVVSAFALGVIYTAARLVFHAWFTTKQIFNKD